MDMHRTADLSFWNLSASRFVLWLNFFHMSMNRLVVVLLSLAAFSVLFSCGKKEDDTIKIGYWRGTLNVQGHELPFVFEVVEENHLPVLYLINASERLRVDELSFAQDTVTIPLHVFDATLKAKINEGRLVGFWSKDSYDDYQIDFEATFGNTERFAVKASAAVADITGRWRVVFSSEGEENPAVGEFVQQGDQVRGTFLTTTGDYRYLEGVLDGNEMKLSTFDGEHAFLFQAELLPNGTLEGDFWSGSHWHEAFSASRDEDFSLPDATSLTFLKEGYDRISFSFPGLDGSPVTLDDNKYQDKVVLLQLFGTWCPNCMDETRFLAEWYNKNADRGVAIIGLSYERKDDFDYAVERINRVRNTLGASYDFVVAGTSSKEEAGKTLPMLNAIISYPTLIILDRNQQVRRIHTGFTGPGTGNHYEAFVEEFNLFMDKLLSE